MRTVEIITHCWRYSRALRYQLSSLFSHPPKEVTIDLTVRWSPNDEQTDDVLGEFYGRKRPSSVMIFSYPMDLPMLLNRSIGRNNSARQTSADLVWFADCDYYFGEGCLDALADVPIHPDQPGYSLLYYPQTTLISKDHATGDAYSDRVANKTGLVEIDPADFIAKKEKFAIGGIQIVPGDIARKIGYVNSNPHQMRPVTDGKWRDTKGDMFLRKLLDTKGKAIDLPNCYRIRQTQKGEVDTRKV